MSSFLLICIKQNCSAANHFSFKDQHNSIIFQYILETAERGTQRIYHTRLTIFQRLSNDEYLGMLLRHSFRIGGKSNFNYTVFFFAHTRNASTM